MKLTADNIRFIDSYLQNSGVKYIDIRMEMVDHIATELEGTEGSFYDLFKNYMAANKSQLLKSNRRFANAAIVTALRAIGREMLGSWFLVPLSLMLMLLYLLTPIPDEFVEWTQGTYVVCFAMFVIYFRVSKNSKKNLFALTDKLLLWGWVVVYLGNTVLLHSKFSTDYEFIGCAFLLAFSIALLSAYHKATLKYKRQYYA